MKVDFQHIYSLCRVQCMVIWKKWKGVVKLELGILKILCEACSLVYIVKGVCSVFSRFGAYGKSCAQTDQGVVHMYRARFPQVATQGHLPVSKNNYCYVCTCHRLNWVRIVTQPGGNMSWEVSIGIVNGHNLVCVPQQISFTYVSMLCQYE